MKLDSSKWLLAPLAALALAVGGCDPYPSTATVSKPEIIRVLAVDLFAANSPTCPSSNCVETAPASGLPWDVVGLDLLSNQAVPAPPPAMTAPPVGYQLIDVQVNELLDGSTIEATPQTCVPATNMTITSDAPVAGETFYLCYDPTSADPAVGAQFYFFRMPPGLVFDGLDNPANEGAAFAPGTTYTMTGTVKDHQGRSLDVNVAASTLTIPTVTSYTWTEVDLAWAAVTGATSYAVERAPDASGAPGTFAAVTGCTGIAQPAGTPPPPLTCSDTGPLSPGTTYWYHVVTTGPGTATSTGSAVAITTSPPATFSSIGWSSLIVNWVQDGANTYDVWKAPDNGSGAPGTWAKVTTTAANVTTYTDPAVAAGKTYWYQIVDPSGAASPPIPPAKSTANLSAPAAVTALPAPKLASSGGTTATITWPADLANTGGTYTVQRAPDTNGAPGTFGAASAACTSVTGTTCTDTGLTAGATYWYQVVSTEGTVKVTSLADSVAVTSWAVPTLTSAPHQVTVTWTAFPAATTYDVQRAPDANGVPGAWTTLTQTPITAPTAGLTFTDAPVSETPLGYLTGLTTGAVYWYRVVANGATAVLQVGNAVQTTIAP